MDRDEFEFIISEPWGGRSNHEDGKPCSVSWYQYDPTGQWVGSVRFESHRVRAGTVEHSLKHGIKHPKSPFRCETLISSDSFEDEPGYFWLCRP